MNQDDPTLRLFLSADLIGSTALKSESIGTNDVPEWLITFTDFYAEFPSVFSEAQTEYQSPGVEFWKGIGDELLWSAVLRQGDDSVKLIRAFSEALGRYNKRLEEGEKKVRLKGTAWLAGFPYTHKVVKLPDGRDDFIGPSIDTGFRLSRFSTQMKLVISVELAWMLLKCLPLISDVKINFDESEPMKGVLGGKPYPIIWVECDSQLEHQEYELCHPMRPPDWTAKLEKYCRDFIVAADGKIIAPFILGDTPFGEPNHKFLVWQAAQQHKGKEPVESYDQSNAPIEGDSPAQVSEEVRLLPIPDGEMQKSV